MLGREFRRLAQKQFWKHSETHKTVNTTFDAVIKQIGALYILINGKWPVDNSRLPTPQFYESHCTCKRNFQGTVLI